jgi:hypothetical protein
MANRKWEEVRSARWKESQQGLGRNGSDQWPATSDRGAKACERRPATSYQESTTNDARPGR